MAGVTKRFYDYEHKVWEQRWVVEAELMAAFQLRHGLRRQEARGYCSMKLFDTSTTMTRNFIHIKHV